MADDVRLRNEFAAARINLEIDLESPPPIPKSIVGGHFVEGNLNLVIGDPGSYKTFVMLEIVSAIACGRPAFDVFPVQQGRTAFITGDDPREVIVDRLLALNAENANGRRVLDPEVKRALVDNIDVRPIDSIVSFRNRSLRSALEEMAREYRFIVLDPLRHFVGDADENAAEEIYAQLTPIREVAMKTGCAITMVHHSNKSRGDNKMNNFRGSSAIRGLSRALVNIDRINFGVSPARISISGENRYSSEPESFILEVEKHGDCVKFSRPALQDAIYQRIIEAKKNGISTNELCEIFAAPASAVRAAVYRMKDRGLVKSHKEGKESIWVATAKIDTSVGGPSAIGAVGIRQDY